MPWNDQHKELYRILHTMKGNARTLHLNQLVSTIHEAESLFEQAPPNGSDSFNPQRLQPIEDVLNPYVLIFEKNFAAYWETSKVSVSRRMAIQLIDRMRGVGGHLELKYSGALVEKR